VVGPISSYQHYFSLKHVIKNPRFQSLSYIDKTAFMLDAKMCINVARRTACYTVKPNVVNHIFGRFYS